MSIALRRAGEAAILPETGLELSIVIPCLNEAETIGTCVVKAVGFLRRHCIRGEVVVADNGSTDDSRAIVRGLGGRVVEVPVRGYGAALRAGTAAARGRYVIIGDADDSYDFSDLMPFLASLRAGNELVVGNRFKGGIKPGAMPALHKYLGNPVLSFIGRLLFRVGLGDFHCGLRGFAREAILGLDLHTTGMEFASEMIVCASLAGLSIAEVPTILSKDGRSRPPHLRTWRDGWRHLRFLLLYSPRWLFFYPGFALIVIGLAMNLLLLPGPVTIGLGVVLDIHTMLVADAAAIVGVQSVCFALIASNTRQRASCCRSRRAIAASSTSSRWSACCCSAASSSLPACSASGPPLRAGRSSILAISA
jgi:Glycosyl transferase family 2